MKRNIIIALIACSVIALDASAKKKKKKGFYEGQKTVHVGIGFPSMVNTSKKDLSIYGDAKTNGMPPVSMRFESAVSENISFGAFLGYTKEKVTITDRTNPKNINGFDYSFTIVGVRAGFHVPLKSKKLDPYGALMLGYNMTKGKPFGENNYFDEPKSKLTYSFHTGVNYYVNPKFALFAEAGYGFALANVGATVRF